MLCYVTTFSQFTRQTLLRVKLFVYLRDVTLHCMSAPFIAFIHLQSLAIRPIRIRRRSWSLTRAVGDPACYRAITRRSIAVLFWPCCATVDVECSKSRMSVGILDCGRERKMRCIRIWWKMVQNYRCPSHSVTEETWFGRRQSSACTTDLYLYILKAVNAYIPVFVAFLCPMSTFLCQSDWVHLLQAA